MLTSDPFTLVVEVAGRTWSFDLERGSHEVLVESIRARLFVLDGDTVVHTGHGDSTTIGAEAARLDG